MKERTKFTFLIWLIPCILLFSIPLIVYKTGTENTSRTVEFITPYDNINKLAELTNQPKEDLYKELKNLGISSLSMTKNSLKVLENKGYISMLSFGEMNEMRGLLGEYKPKQKETTYILIFDRALEEEIIGMIRSRFSEDILGEETTFKGIKMIEIGKSMTDVANLSLPYLENEVKEITDNGFRIAPILENDWEDQKNAVIEQITKWKKEGFLSKTLYLNGDVLGYPRHLEINKPFSTLGSDPLKIIEPEDTNSELVSKKELDTFIEEHLVRTHLIPAVEIKKYYDNKKMDALSDRITLAVKERNIHTIYFEFPLPSQKKDEKIISLIKKEIEESVTELEKVGFKTGISGSFNQKEASWTMYISMALSILSVLFISLTFSILHKKLGVISFIGFLLFMLLFEIIGKGMLYFQGMMLLVAILIPVVSVMVLTSYLEKKKEKVSVIVSIILFILTSILTLSLGLILPGMHYEIDFVLYIEQFRGVRVMHIIPILLAAIIVLYYYKASLKAIVSFLKVKIAVYHIAIVGVIAFVLGIVGMFYLMRTGNGGTLLPFEDVFRRKMEDTFGVRPRTKEILIGHPILIACIYYWNRYKLLRWLLPIAIIGQLSMINTFTHFHTPFIYSLLRSLYGIGISIVMGILFIVLIEICIYVGKKIWDKGKRFIETIEKEKAED